MPSFRDTHFHVALELEVARPKFGGRSGACHRAGQRPDPLARPGMTKPQAKVGIGRNRLIAPMIIRTKNTSTIPCTTANTGPDGGLPGASAVNAGTLRKL